MIRANSNDNCTPRYGIDRRAWERICSLARDYQDADGCYDWDGVTPPDPRTTNPRLLFARWLVDTGRLQP